MTTIHLETLIRAPVDVVFDLARDLDLHASSMSAYRETAVAGRTNGRIEAGETVTWRARHFGLWWTLSSRIIDVRPRERFADEQARGPFRSFRHVHTFQEVPSGTLMVDDWTHTAPFGPVGRLVDRLVLAGHLRRLLEVRNRHLKGVAEAAAANPGGETR